MPPQRRSSPHGVPAGLVAAPRPPPVALPPPAAAPSPPSPVPAPPPKPRWGALHSRPHAGWWLERVFFKPIKAHNGKRGPKKRREGGTEEACGHTGPHTGGRTHRAGQQQAGAALLPHTGRKGMTDPEERKHCPGQGALLAHRPPVPPSPSPPQGNVAMSAPGEVQLLPHSSASGKPVTSPTSLRGCAPCVKVSL